MLTVLAILVAGGTNAADWPCYRGPARDGHTTERIANWPPRELWRAQVGEGYSQIVVSEGRVYAMGWTNKVTSSQDVLYCFIESSTGTNPAPLWQSSYSTGYGPDGGFKGPRATPTVDGGEIYTLAHDGRLACLNKITGKAKWAVTVTNGMPGWGFAGSPFIEGNNVIINAGGSGFAIDKSGTRTNWSSAGKAAYSSPFAVTMGGRRTLVIAGDAGVSGVNPADGSVLWYYAMISGTMLDPIISGNRAWTSKANDSSTPGSLAMDINGSGQCTNIAWNNIRIGNGVNSAVLRDGYLYCLGNIDGLLCMDFATGNKMWASTNSNVRFSPYGGILLADDQLVVADDEYGKVELVVAQATPSGYNEMRRATNLVAGLMWTAPTLANGKLYIRTHDGTVIAYDVSSSDPRVP